MKDAAIGILIIAAINLTVYITPAPIVGGYHAVPDRGAGWLEGTTWLTDDWGRTVLAGHTPGDFERLHDLVPGDMIVVVTDGGRRVYRVTEFIYAQASETDYLAPTETPTLTLITCTTSQSGVRVVINAELMTDTD